MKANFTVFLLCSGFTILFICFIIFAFRQTVTENVSDEFHDGIGIERTLTNELVLSLPPCHSFGERLWLHHISGECYEVGTQGPCGESMTFYKHPNKTLNRLGYCDCDDIVEIKSNIPECEVIQRPLLYYPDHDSCYFVFSQGPCADGMWLVLDNHGIPECKPNICSAKRGTHSEDCSFWFSEGGDCFRANTRGYCSSGHLLKAVKNNWKPECQKDVHSDCRITEEVSIATLQCRPGNRLDFLNMCSMVTNNAAETKIEHGQLRSSKNIY